jgi:hypothetical protein
MSLNTSVIADAIKSRKARKIIKVRMKVMANIANIAKVHNFGDEWLKSVFVKANFIIPKAIDERMPEKVVYSDEAMKILKTQNIYLVYFRDKSGFEHYLGYFVKH